MRYFILFFVLLAFSVTTTFAQVAQDTTWYVQTKDGNAFIGKITSRDENKIVLKTDKIGELTIQRSDIRNMNAIDASRIVKGKLWLDNPQSARYLWAPNGYGLKKGEAYFQNVWVLFNQVSVGVTDHFSIGAGMIPLFLFSGSPTPIWITPKFSIPVSENKVNVGAGALLGTVTSESHSDFGLVYGITTLGSRDKNISLGLGYGYAGGQWGNTPTISLSSLLRIGSKSYLLTENYYIPIGKDFLVMSSVGARIIINRIGLDFGGVIPIQSRDNTVFIIPWLGVTVPFGRISGQKK